jgi:hypothetical protein
MKAIVVRSKATRKVLRGAIFASRDEVMPFGVSAYKSSVLSHQQFKDGDFAHYIRIRYLRQTLTEWKQNVRENHGNVIFFQEVISNG